MYKEKAIIITIGDELLIGQVVDTNSVWLGEQLNLLGIEVCEKLTVSDTREGILKGLNQVAINADYVFLTGGLGPTKDDITKNVLANYFDDKMIFHEPTWRNIQQLLEDYGKTPNEAHKEQCYMPESAKILTNKMGTAPGMLFEKEDFILVSMPGVPYEMKSLVKTHVIPLLKNKKSESTIYHRTILTASIGESKIAEKITHITDSFSSNIKIAFLPHFASVRLRITGTGSNEEEVKNLVDQYVHKISQELGTVVYGYDNDTIISAIGQICKKHELNLGTAESCTGGKVASMIVGQAGSSAFYQGSIVSYSNELKHDLLSVKTQTLQNHGAVSEAVVVEMVAGALTRLGVDVAISISGIAGPSGGTPDKPVGLIWIACGNKERTDTKKLQLSKSRQINIEFAAMNALDMLRIFLLKNY